MNEKRHTGMGLGICMLAGILLFHPIVAGVDILPDLLGYLLLYVGLARLSDLNGHINEARRRFRVMLFVGAGQIFATYIVYGMIEGMMQERPAEMSAYEGPMLTLLFTFVLLVLQWFFLIPAWKELFLGLGTMAERFHCTELMHEHRGKTRCERLASLSAFFVVTASLFSLLPEASVLTSYEAHKGNPLFPFDWFEYVVLFRTAACAVSAIVGLIWLISYLRCLAAFRRNRDFIEQAVTAYETEILPQTGMLTVRRFRSAFLLFTVGSVFAMSIRVNNRALLPGVVFAVFVIVGVLLLGNRIAKKQGCITAAVLLALVSAAQLVTNHLFLQKHLPEASLYETDAYWRFFTVRVLDAAEAAATLILIAALLGVLYELVRTYTAVEYGTKGSEALSYYATERQHKAFQKRMIILFVIFFLSAIATVVDAIYRLELGWIWIIALVCSTVGVWNLHSLTQDICEQIGYFYHSDGMNKNV